MTTKIDTFTITETPDTLVVDYRMTLKDWFDTILTLAFTAICATMACLLLATGFSKQQYLLIGGGLVFVFVAVLQGISGFSLLFQARKNKLVFDKNEDILIVKNIIFTSKKISMNDVDYIFAGGEKEKVLVAEKRKTRIYCTIHAKCSNRPDERLFIIQTDRLFSIEDKKLEKELYIKTNKIATALSKGLSVGYQWTGYKEAK